MKKYKIFLTIFICFIIINIVIFPSLYIQVTLDGLSAWATNVLPSLLAFIFFSKVLSSLGVIEKLANRFSSPMQKLFRTSGTSGYVFLMSVISGYPVGAKMTSDLYLSRKISRSEAVRMTSFCSTSGPMFIIGAVGAGMFNSAFSGYIIFISHILGAFLNGLLYRKIKLKELPPEAEVKAQNTDLNSIIVDSALSIISVGLIIAIFFVIITSLSPIINLLPENLAAFTSGLIEITKGCMQLSKGICWLFNIVAATFVISFGGISTMLQSLTFLEKIKMPVWLFALQKFTHAILASLICLIICLIV